MKMAFDVIVAAETNEVDYVVFTVVVLAFIVKDYSLQDQSYY